MRRPRVSPQEMEVAAIDQGAAGLPEDEDWIFLVDGVAQKDETAGNAQPPEGDGDDAALAPFARDPLDEESGEEDALPDEPDEQPESFSH